MASFLEDKQVIQTVGRDPTNYRSIVATNAPFTKAPLMVQTSAFPNPTLLGFLRVDIFMLVECLHGFHCPSGNSFLSCWKLISIGVTCVSLSRLLGPKELNFVLPKGTKRLSRSQIFMFCFDFEWLSPTLGFGDLSKPFKCQVLVYW